MRSVAQSVNFIPGRTLTPWARVMNPQAIGANARGELLTSATRDAERASAVEARNEALRDAAGKETTIPLMDSPCMEPSDVDLEIGRSERHLTGRVVVRAGCPAGGKCKTSAVDVYWSQYIRFGADGRLEALFFAQAPDHRWSRDSPLRPRSSWRPAINAEGQAWEQRWRRWVRRQPRAR
jgi:hypothetical protein